MNRFKNMPQIFAPCVKFHNVTNTNVTCSVHITSL